MANINTTRDFVPAFRVRLMEDVVPRHRLMDGVPGFRLNPDGSAGQSLPYGQTEPMPVSHKPAVPLPGVRPYPGPGLHPPCEWRQVAPGFPWECVPLPTPLPPPPPFVPPVFQPLPPRLPREPWTPPWPPNMQP